MSTTTTTAPRPRQRYSPACSATNAGISLPRWLAISWVSASATATKPESKTSASRNQEDKLSEGEKEEMLAFSKAGTILSILKSRARRTLGVKLEIPTY